LDAVLEHGNCLENIPILTDDVVGEEATSVLRCTSNVKVILKEKKLTAKGLRYFSANQVNDDDIELN
jgi:hypothetical protein